ncbi:MAG: class flavin-dependent oxidoreductase, partial [Actinomycetia bacterium]|nr:class flavin-dependent oxidoreductase [Actinomycetes bacterium]
ERPAFSLVDAAIDVARAAEATGFAGVVIPYDPAGDDSWILAPLLARETPRLDIVPEFQPGFATAVYTAKLAFSFQRFFADRLGWKLALDTDVTAQRAVGDFVEGLDRYVRADELLTVSRGVWEHGPFDFTGAFFEAEGSGFFDGNTSTRAFLGHDLARRPHPRIYLDGESVAALQLSAKHADVHLFETTEPERLSSLVDDLRRLAGDRPVGIGLALRVLGRDTEAEARRDADRVGHNRPGLVGSFDQVIEGLRSFADLGVTTFVLDSHDPLEAYQVGERVLPFLEGVPA